ncbi:MAG: nucleotidyltransferase domain-containing protein [Mariprofundaceae bacterium]|nr:nucleotidyltransferase domain-containing protein [Mariprofundaceae bacterium]
MDIDGMIVKHVRHAFPVMQAIYRFGSTVTEGERPGQSDVDVAVYAGFQLEQQQLWFVSQALADELRQDVDLIDLAQSSTVMTMQVLGKGRRVFFLDEAFVGAFESRVYADYARLNEERAGILLDIRARGSIYG